MSSALAHFDRLVKERTDGPEREELLQARAEVDEGDEELATDILLSADLETQPVRCLASALLVVECHLGGSHDFYMDWALLYLALAAASLGEDWSESARDVLREVRCGARSSDYGRMALIAESVLSAAQFRRSAKAADVPMIFDSYVADRPISLAVQPLTELVSGLQVAQSELRALGSEIRTEWLVLPEGPFDPPIIVRPPPEEIDTDRSGES